MTKFCHSSPPNNIYYKTPKITKLSWEKKTPLTVQKSQQAKASNAKNYIFFTLLFYYCQVNHLFKQQHRVHQGKLYTDFSSQAMSQSDKCYLPILLYQHTLKPRGKKSN